MELRYLRYFVAVARERHFTKAAKALGMSQPPLSQQIKRLEEEVGTPLFRRLTRGVELTEAGKAFYEDACEILALSDIAVEKVRGIARGLNGNLSIGIASSDAFHPMIFTLIRHFQLQNMAVKIHQREANMSSLTTMLAEGELDIAFVRLPCESSKAFELKILDREPMVVVLHCDHPLAERGALTLDQLQDTPVVLFPQDIAPCLYDRVYTCCARSGLTWNTRDSAHSFRRLSAWYPQAVALPWCRSRWWSFLRRMSLIIRLSHRSSIPISRCAGGVLNAHER
jgi:DNA-binding transcriptional LysR family regulator